jgi:pyrroloquinoline quinone biosynthesis protein B
LNNKDVRVIVLGTAQDGGFPQVGCKGKCCNEAWKDVTLKRKVSSLAIIYDNDCWLIDITPDFRHQFSMIGDEIGRLPNISGIFITHAHVGHYMGLLDLGLEVMNTHSIPVYVMPKMNEFLQNNAPFSQLIELNNIRIELINDGEEIQLNNHLSIMSFLVPHRNEFSETIGCNVKSENKSLVYVSDIDSWDEWKMDVNELIRNNDVLLLDGTFYDSTELKNRNINDVPHPFIMDSLVKFSLLEEVDRKKVYFTHLNHTNPAIQKTSLERLAIMNESCNVAEDGMVFTL